MQSFSVIANEIALRVMYRTVCSSWRHLVNTNVSIYYGCRTLLPYVTRMRRIGKIGEYVS